MFAFEPAARRAPSFDSRSAQGSRSPGASTHPAAALATGLQRTFGNQAVLRMLGRTITQEVPDTGPPVVVQRSPATWAKDPTTAAISSYRGSKKYWIPLKALVTQYSSLPVDDVDGRRATLHALRGTITEWRANQGKNWWLSELDKSKAAAVLRLETLMDQENREMEKKEEKMKTVVPSKPKTVTPSLPMMIPRGSVKGGGPSAGSSSFYSALDSTPSSGELGLMRTVMQREVAPLRDQNKCKVVIGVSGTLNTHDGRFAIDTQGSWARYLILKEGGTAVLYVSQEVASSDFDEEMGMSFFAEYPTLSSHAQIDGDVIAAGDMIVSKGHVKTISNQSGTWQPGGRNLAMTLKLLVRTGIVDEDALVTGKVTVKQYMHRPDGYDVDAGVLVTIMGQALSGKLRA